MCVLLACVAGATGQQNKSEGESMATTVPSIPQVGQNAPDFKLPANDGKTYSLKDLSGSKAVVLYFYPKADAPGCTKEACGFRDAISQYKKLNVAVLGVSPDPVEDVQKFTTKYTLNFPLLADSDHSVCEKYGVWQEKNNYGKNYWGAARTTFVIVNGKIVKVFEKVKPEGHEAEVLTWLKDNVK